MRIAALLALSSLSLGLIACGSTAPVEDTPVAPPHQVSPDAPAASKPPVIVSKVWRGELLTLITDVEANCELSAKPYAGNSIGPKPMTKRQLADGTWQFLGSLPAGAYTNIFIYCENAQGYVFG